MLGEEFCGDDNAEVARVVMRGIQDAANHLGIRGAGIGGSEMQVHAVDLVFHLALRILETITDGIQRRINQIVHVFGADSGDFTLRSHLRRHNANDVAPLVIQFDVLADGGRSAE